MELLKRMKNAEKNYFRKILICVGWLLVWQFISLAVGNKVLLVGPLDTLRALVLHATEPVFWQACGGSVLRIGLGFAAGMLIGVIFAVISAHKKIAEEILSPVMTLLKTMPVASFVVLFLIWWSSSFLAVAISFCVTLPNLYLNTLEGLKSCDKKLLEMTKVFGVSGRDKFFYVYRPALKPFWDSAICLAAGMSWKAGVAAEVIGLPNHAIGERLYMSKIHLDTAGVLAWTVVVVCLSVGFEKFVRAVWKRFCEWEPACKGAVLNAMMQGNGSRKHGKQGATVPNDEKEYLRLNELTKAYDGKNVVDAITAEYYPGEIYYFDSPSGSGKTTLFRLIAGLEKPDCGNVEGNITSIGYLFQEDRLCEEYSAVKNIELITGSKFVAQEALKELLDAEDIEKPCKELSGGMKRRVALVRAMISGADVILLDEPYNGLDEENRTKVTAYVENRGRGSIVLIATHIR